MFRTGWNVAAFLAIVAAGTSVLAQQPGPTVAYPEHAQQFIKQYCLDCHNAETQEGKLRLDEHPNAEQLLQNKQLWWRVLKNVRAELMPPAKSDQPSQAERKALAAWIERDVFGIDPQNPPAGPRSFRRLNRTEYRQTIRDLMGIDFNAEIVFPPDDTGFGFDNVGDALSISPMLLEKYVQAATAVVAEAVPTVTWIKPTRRITGHQFKSDQGIDGDRIRHNQPTTVGYVFKAQHVGKYQIKIHERLHGSFDFHPGRYSIEFRIDDSVIHASQYKWEEHKDVVHNIEVDWTVGDHPFSVTLQTLADKESEEGKDPAQGPDERFVSYQLVDVQIVGPVDSDLREHPDRYQRFFHRDEPPAAQGDPTGDAQVRQYAREILERFATRAFRQPVASASIDRLVTMALVHQRDTSATFEAGIAKAMTAVLASPKFLFKLEAPLDAAALSATDPHPQSSVLVSEHTLASRLSYFLWSSMPDETLFELAQQGKLRADLDHQVQRMLKDQRADAFAKNFVGQWLRARDVEHTSMDAVAALGYAKEFEELRQKLQGRFGRRRGGPPPDPETAKALARFRELIAMREKLSPSVRTAMRRETEMSFEYIVSEDRSLVELLDADYVFVNSELAELYGIPNVRGKEMQRIKLPEGSPRGGVLTQGTMLLVTSNPTRTSPVKRGLFILDNLLGTPAPPAPPNVPALEDAQNRFGDRQPSLRELLAVHRENALCSSCHARMDPLGLALENFNAFGGFREVEAGGPIDASGELITGEKFSNVAELKRILATTRRADFYRCVTEKMLVFALGRGLDMQDEWTVDQIVGQLEAGRDDSVYCSMRSSSRLRFSECKGVTQYVLSQSTTILAWLLCGLVFARVRFLEALRGPGCGS